MVRLHQSWGRQRRPTCCGLKRCPHPQKRAVGNFNARQMRGDLRIRSGGSPTSCGTLLAFRKTEHSTPACVTLRTVSGEAANLECRDLSQLFPVAEPLSPFGGAAGISPGRRRGTATFDEGEIERKKAAIFCLPQTSCTRIGRGCSLGGFHRQQPCS